VISIRFVQPTTMLPQCGAPRKATMDPQNKNKLSHVKVAVQISGRAAVAEASLRTKPLLISVNTMGEPKMTTSPPMPCSRLPTNHFGSGGKMPAQK